MPKIRDFPPTFPLGASTEFVPIDERVHPFINERRKELAPAGSAFAGIQGDSRIWVGVALAKSESATACAFVPHEPDGVSFVEGPHGERYRRVAHNGLINCYPEPAEPAKPKPLTFPRLLADAENIMLLSHGAPNATLLWRLLKGLSDENVHDLLVFGSDAVNMESVNALFRVFTDGVQPNDTPAIAAAMAAKTAQPTPDPVVSILGQQVSESELAEALALIRQKNAPPAEKETPRGLMCVAPMDHRLGRWNEA